MENLTLYFYWVYVKLYNMSYPYVHLKNYGKVDSQKRATHHHKES